MTVLTMDASEGVRAALRWKHSRVLEPYKCSWCGEQKGECPHCRVLVHEDEFVSGKGCVICNLEVRRLAIEHKLKNSGE